MLAKAGVTGGDRKRSKSSLRRKLTPGVRGAVLTAHTHPKLADARMSNTILLCLVNE